MSKNLKIDLTIPAQTNLAELRTIESNLDPARTPLQVSFTNDGPPKRSSANERSDKSLQHREGAGDDRHRLVVGGARQRDAAKAHGAPETDDARVGEHVRRSDRTHEVGGLIDGRHRPVA